MAEVKMFPECLPVSSDCQNIFNHLFYNIFISTHICLKLDRCGWKTKDNHIQITKFWIANFQACRQQQACIFFICHFQKLPEIDR